MLNFFLKKRYRQDIEYFDETWKERIKIMSLYIGKNESVVDIGCGKMWLKEYLDVHQQYIGIDYKDRGGNIVCDLNKEPFPNVSGNTFFLSGIIEYIQDVDTFFKNITEHNAEKIILSYCINDLPYQANHKGREHNGRVNHLSRNDLVQKFEYLGFKQEGVTINYIGNYIMQFIKI